MLARVRLVAARKSSVQAAASLSTSLALNRSHHDNYICSAVSLDSPHSVPPLDHQLVCVDQLAASMWMRRCLPAHKLVHTPLLLRPTVNPLPLSPTVGQQPAWRWRQRRVRQRRRLASPA